MLLLYTLWRHFRHAIQQSAIQAFICLTQAAMETIPLCTRISVALQDMRPECCNSNGSENNSKKNQLVRQSLSLLILVEEEEQLIRIEQVQNIISAKLCSLQLSNPYNQTQKNKSRDLIIEKQQSLLKRKPNKENAIMLSFYGTRSRIKIEHTGLKIYRLMNR